MTDRPTDKVNYILDANRDRVSSQKMKMRKSDWLSE